MTLKEAALKVADELRPHFMSALQAVGVSATEVVVYTTKKRYHCPPLDKFLKEGCGGWPVRVVHTGLVEVKTV
jgi:hypothetical protein